MTQIERAQPQFELNKCLLNFILKLQSIDLKIELNITVFCSILGTYGIKYKKRDENHL